MKLKFKLIIGSIILIMLYGYGKEDNSDKQLPKQEIASESNIDERNQSETLPNIENKEQEKTQQTNVNNSNNIKDEAVKSAQTLSDRFPGYTLIEVDGGNRNGNRKANVVVDVGFGDREYWAFTNAYGQLVRIIADKIIPQDSHREPVNSDGRYYDDEAYVPGVEAADLDQGHVIADSLGGVANAYNITPQNSILNRHGDQAYMEKVMRQAGGSTNFEAIITYPNTTTQIPNSYKYSYYINGNKVELSFENKDPSETATSETADTNVAKPQINSSSNQPEQQPSEAELIRKIDTNNNGQISIKEAKSAGYKMPIYSNHWLYKYMTDGDGDGMVGE